MRDEKKAVAAGRNTFPKTPPTVSRGFFRFINGSLPTRKDDEDIMHKNSSPDSKREGRNSSVRRACVSGLVMLAAIAGLSLQFGCESGNGGKSAPAIEGWAKQFAVVTSGQGVAGAAAYTRGTSVTVLPIYYNTAALSWFYGSLLDDKEDLVPSNLVPADSSAVQLVLITTCNSEKSTKVGYTSGGGFFHWTCHADLREARTGRLVASQNFAGNNVAPATVTGPSGVPVGASDRASMVPAVRAWLMAYL